MIQCGSHEIVNMSCICGGEEYVDYGRTRGDISCTVTKLF